MKSLESAVLALLATHAQPTFGVIVGIEDLSLYWTSVPAGVTFSGTVYTAKGVTVEGIGESMLADVMSATLVVGSLDDTEQARVRADSFRGLTATVELILLDGTTWTRTGRVWSYTIDADSADDQQITARLASSDAVAGTSVPRRTTQEQGCQHTFQGEGCPFRWHPNVHSAALKTCDKSFAACRDHFPDVTIAGVKHVQPKPFGGFLGAISAKLVLR